MQFVLPDGTRTTLRANDVIELCGTANVTMVITRPMPDGVVAPIHLRLDDGQTKRFDWAWVLSAPYCTFKAEAAIHLMAAALGLDVETEARPDWMFKILTLRDPRNTS